MKPKYRGKAKLCYRDTHSNIVYIKTEDIDVDIAKYVKTRFDTSNYELDRPLPKGKNKFAALRPKKIWRLWTLFRRILNSQQKYWSKKHNVFTEEVNKIPLNASDHKKLQSIYSTETYAHGRNKEIMHKKKKISVTIP